MADVKISALPAASTPLAGTEVLPIVQGGTTDKVSVANLTAGRTVAAGALNVDGNVGIGNTAGAARLRVSAAAAVNAPVLGNVSNYPAFISNNDTGYGLGIGTAAGDGHVWLQAQRSDTATSFNLTLNEAGGNVGIGMSSPTRRLDVVGNVAFTNTNARFRLSNTAGTAATLLSGADSGVAFTGTETNAPFYFITNNTESMRITAAGNVGIGQSYGLTNSRLVVTGQSAGADGAYATGVGSIVLNEAGRTSVNNTGGFEFKTSVFGAGYGAKIMAFDDSTLVFGLRSNSATYTERMRLTLDGQLLVGTSTVYSDGTIGAPVLQWTALAGVRAGAASRADTTGSIIGIAFVNPNGVVGSISTSGSGTAYTTSSDYRLKHDVAPLTGGLATIAALKPSTYKWNADGSYGEGFIAHELAEHIPQAVTGDKDALNEDGSIKPQGVDYSKVVVHLVAAVQELTAKVAALEAR